jgi:DNA polymerase-3 subunit chi
MPHVTFYLLPDAVSAEQPSDKSDHAVALLACQLATARFRQNQTVFLLTQTQTQAEQLDEMLWQQDPHSFVPHGLSDEATVTQAPVEIGMAMPKRSRQVLINLAESIPAFANRFAQIIDFVPSDELQKQQARDRYKQYRALGFTLETVPAPTLP